MSDESPPVPVPVPAPVPKPWYKKVHVWVGILTLAAATVDEVVKMGILPDWWMKVLSVGGSLALVFAARIRALWVLWQMKEPE